MQNVIQKSIAGLALVVVILLSACKKGDDNDPQAAPNTLITKIIAPSENDPGQYDTATISYNADNTVHQITSVSGSAEVADFYYTPGLIRKVSAYPGGTETIVDSILLGANGLPTASYEKYDFYPTLNTAQYYTYNTAGELIQTIVLYPNLTGYPADTVTHTWANGDMTSQVSTSGERDFNYTYNTAEACSPGDYLYLAHLVATGQTMKPNSHLCIGASGGTDPAILSYIYDSDHRIIKYTSTQNGQIEGEAFFSY